MSSGKAAVARRIADLDQQVVDRYTKYWISIAPKTLEQRYSRWVFSAMSINTGWEQNVDGYVAVMAMPWKSISELQEIMVAAGVGLHGAKAASVWAIYTAYCDPVVGPRIFGHPAEVGWGGPGWQAWRNRLLELTDGTAKKKLPWSGLKTVSFAHEMCWPAECGVFAVDTHVARWYGLKGSLTPKKYHMIENHWMETCRGHGFPSAIARHIMWDQDHGYESTSYWSHVFEMSR